MGHGDIGAIGAQEVHERGTRGEREVHERGTRGAREGHERGTRGAREVHRLTSLRPPFLGSNPAVAIDLGRRKVKRCTSRAARVGH